MANTDLPITDTIKKNPKILFQLRQALGILYDENGKLTPGNETEAKSLLEQIHSPEIGIPKNYTIKEIGIVIEKWYETLTRAPEFSEPTMTGAPEYSVSSNTLTPDQLAQFQEEARVQQEKIKKTQVKSKLLTEADIKREQEIYAEEIKKAKEAEAALENKNVYYKVEENKISETQEIKNFKVNAGANPKDFIDDAVKTFEEEPGVKDLKTDEVKIESEQAAITTYKVLTDDSPLVEAAVTSKIISSPDILKKITSDIEIQQVLQDAGYFLIDKNKSQFELSKQFINLSKIDGFTKIENIKIEISNTPKEGYKEFDINHHIITPHLENLGDSNILISDLKNLGEGEIKSKIISNIGGRLESYIARLPANSAISQIYNSEVVRVGLSSLGVIEAAPWVAAEGSLLGKVIFSSGLGPLAGFIQTKLGINLGVKLGAAAATEGATGIGLAATITAAFAWTGPLAPVIGAAGAFLIETVAMKVVGKVVGWVKSKIPLGGIKKWSAVVIGGLAVLVTAPFIGIGGGLVAGGITTGISMALGAGAGGITLGGIGGGIVGFFGALAGATIGAIGVPILVTLLGFPLLVALILFIINSGAYVVPSSSSTGFICNMTEAGVKQTGSSVANAATCIVSYLNKYHLNPLFVELLNTSSWQDLGRELPQPAFEALSLSAPIDGHLQCVGFAAASAGFAYGKSFQQINACSYINNPPVGYKYFSGTKGIKPGDFFLIDGSNGCSPNSPGHIGVVTSVDGALISCADANAVGPGKARTSNGCFALSQLTGYFTK